MTLYNIDVREIIHSAPWPKGLVLDIIEKTNDLEPFLQLVLYRQNINQFPHDEKMRLFTTLNDVLTKIRQAGCPIYLEVAVGDGKRVG